MRGIKPPQCLNCAIELQGATSLSNNIRESPNNN